MDSIGATHIKDVTGPLAPDLAIGFEKYLLSL